MTDQPEPAEVKLGGAQGRPPSLLDAVIPVVALIALIALSVYLFGLDATNGPLQVALFTAMTVAALVAHKDGYSYPAIGDAVIGGISTAMGAIFILLAVGALIGVWNMSGTMGVAFVGMAHISGVSPEITAGAVISGGYFGDKMSPLSETTILTPSLVAGGETTGQHIREMIWTVGPSL